MWKWMNYNMKHENMQTCVGISAESPILGIPDEIPIYKNFIKWWLFIWIMNKIGLLRLSNESRYTPSS